MAKEKNTTKKNVEKKATTPKKRRKDLDRDMYVTIMNNTTGKVVYRSKKTGADIVLLEYGDIEEIQLNELVSMKSAHPRYLKEPFIIIIGENAEEVIDYLGLTELYKNILTPEEVKRFLNSRMPVNKFKNTLKKMPKGMLNLIVNIVRDKIEKGTFDSYAKIKAIEEICNINLLES